MTRPTVRLAIDIGGTFTDVVLESGGRLTTAKMLTTEGSPERAVMAGVEAVLAEAAVAPEAVQVTLHGTTLATNAIIQRKGARTALIVTKGHRDSLEMAHENRFAQYDIMADPPEPLVPRARRWPVRERLNWRGEALTPLDEASVEALLPWIAEQRIEAVAVGLLHSYANPAHERRLADIIRSAHPDIPVSLSSEVCPEIREYERQSTTVANAYVQPRMARYLTAMAAALKARGITGPLLMMTSAGGLATLETAIAHPVRLVESGPAGGAILAARVAAQCDLDLVVSFDMGGTTAKVCLIDDGRPVTSRRCEVARAHRFMKGSGLPLTVPVIEMVEIGAGGGSIARFDAVGKLAVGPDSAGADPGPACYDRGGSDPTVTDADLIMGRIAPEGFAGGRLTLSVEKAEAAVAQLCKPQGLSRSEAAYAISETVDEAMANAARVHAAEWGKDITARTMIAFGGAAPLHAARLAEKLGIDRVVVPTNAGVGSAVGFLAAPISFEVVRSRYVRLGDGDAAFVAAGFAEMRAEAEAIVRAGAGADATLTERRTAAMRYVGQGHEIVVGLPVGNVDAATMTALFDAAYKRHFGLTLPGIGIEVLTWTLTLASDAPPIGSAAELWPDAPQVPGTRSVFFPERAAVLETAVHARDRLAPGAVIPGPALITEAQTTTVVPPGFVVDVDAHRHLHMVRRRDGPPQ